MSLNSNIVHEGLWEAFFIPSITSSQESNEIHFGRMWERRNAEGSIVHIISSSDRYALCIIDVTGSPGLG